MNSRNRRSALAILVVVVGCWLVQQPGRAAETSTALAPLNVSADTGEKPQSKVWFHGGTWWAVLPSTSPSGTWVWRLNPNNSWSNVLQLSPRTDVKADVKDTGAVTHVLLYAASSPGATELASIEFVASANTYQLWPGRMVNTPISLPASSETATIDTDSTGRLWLATKSITSVIVYHSDTPYNVVSGPVTLENGINADDIALVTALPNNTVGVLWSNQVTRRFGFKVHLDGADPATWSVDEVPASQSALNVGLGMADDHMNTAVAADGTLYAAVKTSYDTAGATKIALLVRRPTGAWDDLYHVDVNGTRPVVLLDELRGLVRVIYTASESGGNILYKESSTAALDFAAAPQVLIVGSLNNATTTKQNSTGRAVVLASTGTSAQGVLISREDPALVGWWPMNQSSGTVAFDYSGFGAHGPFQGTPSWSTGVAGNALSFNGPATPPDAVVVPHSSALNLASEMTLAAWIKPGRAATQDLIKKVSGSTGYELSLSSPTAVNVQKVFVRLNASDSSRANSITTYPADGNQWIHAAATFDGTRLRLYINGVEESDVPGPAGGIGVNTVPLLIATHPTDVARAFQGDLDDVRIYNRALSSTEIATLASVTLEADLAITKTNNQSSITAGQPVSYTIAVVNNGPRAVTGATVSDTLSGWLTSASWTCSASPGSSCGTPSGSGNINDQVNLAADGTATFTLNATVAAGASGTLSNTASVSVPSGITDPVTANNAATDTDTVVPGGMGGPNGTGDLILVGAGDVAPNCVLGASLANADAVSNLLDGIPGTVFTLGDNAYQNGTAAEFAQCYDATWGRHKPRTRPAAGNHDYNPDPSKTPSPGAEPYFDYFNGQGNANGPAGDRTKGYYSYNIGTAPNLWHVVVLNSECESSGGLWLPGGCAAGSAQEQWLRSDLAASPTNNIIAMFHKPRFSSSAADTSIAHMQALWQALYDYGTDIVLGGHWHNYERLAPTNANGTRDDSYGMRQFIVGTGGISMSGFGTTRSTSEVRNNTTWGALKLTLRASDYDWQFVPIAGQTFTDTGTASVHAAPAVPTVTALSPSTGSTAGGTIVTVTGTNFSTVVAATSIAFGATAATSVSCSSTTTCTATSPAGAGTVDVLVTVGGSTSSPTAAGRFSYFAGNQAPIVDAGANQTISLPSSVSLSGTASDEGVPNPPGTLTTTWSKVSGAGAVTFANVNALSTTATFTLPGTYVLQLAAFDGVLTSTDTVTVTARGLVGHWQMNEGSGTTLVDSSGLNNAATLSGGPAWTTGIRGQALTLNGTTQNGLVPNSASLNPTAAITLAVWIKPAKAAFATQDLIKKAVAGTTNGYELSLAMSGKPFFRLNQVTSTDTFRVNALTSYPLSSIAWQHLAATYDGSSIRIYVNGVLEGTVAGPAAIVANTESIGIGAQSDAARRFEGAMDDARVYDRALSAEEIRLLANRPPTVNAGTDQTVNLPAGASLSGTVTDDGAPTAVVTTTWTQVSGPGTVSFGNPAAPSTSASFSAAGVYVLSLAATDGDLSSADTLTVTVQQPVNQAPAVNAGIDQSITLPAGATLDGTANDDGLPAGAVTTAWSKLSGPGTVTFGNAATVDTTASFSVAGVYVLRLTANDGLLASTDDITITVNPVPGNYALDFGGTNEYVAFGNPAKLHLATFTIETWFNRQGAGTITTTGTGGVTAAVPLVTRGRGEAETTAADTNYFLGIDTATNVLAADFEEGASGTSPSLNHPVRGVTTIAPTDNRWRHAAATYDGTTWRLYLDGQLEAELTVGQPVAAAGNQHAAIASALSTTGVAAGFFDGVLDEVRIWNYARTQIEIGSAVNQRIPNATGLVARWALDEGVGTSVTDSTGTPVGGTIAGTNWSWVTGSPFNLNLRPTVNAGIDQTITLPANAALTGSISDDGLPDPPASVTITWTKVSGPGTALFQSPNAAATTVSFSTAGTYVLQLAATDGEYLATDTVTVTVNASGPVNQAPVVNAGSDQTVTLPASVSLSGAVTDDGLPGTDVTTTWSKLTGPGTVTFADATATATSASFSAAGTYVLQLTADDGELTASDSVTIVVNNIAVNSALDLGGTNAYVNLGQAPGLGTSTFTLELWFRRDGAGIATSSGSGGLSAIPLVTKGMAEGDGSTIDMNYFLGIRSTDGVLGADFEDRATGVNHPVFGTSEILADGTWHHAAATYDGSTWRLYLDGALQSTLVVGNFTPRFDSTQWAAIGSASNSTGGVGTQTRGFFNGAVDEVRIWNYARTSQQILESLNQEISSAPGLLGRWGFGEGTGTTVSDTSGNGLHGTVIGTNFLWVGGAPFRLNQAPGQPVLNAPLNGATGVATSPTLNVAVADPDGDPMSVTFFGRPVPAGAAPEFTIVALPDTQHYVDDPTRAATFTSQTQWIVDNQAAKNIAFVTHLGDIVEHIDAQPIEWTRANSSLSLLEAGGLKWGLAPGNHDMSSAGVATNFDLTFPVSRFSGYPWYGGYLGMDAVQDPVDRQNKDNYQLFSVGGLDFVIIHLEYDMPDYSVAWANRILAQYPNRRAIVTTHLFLNASGSRPSTVLNRANGTPAETVWQQLIRNNCNVFLVLNGHYPGEANRTDVNNCGQPVHQLASDYQSRTNGGDGWLRYMTFKPAENKIFVYTFSPTLNGGAGLFETDVNSQFVLDYNMQGAAFSSIATNNGTVSGSNTTATWAELAAGTRFEWYVTVNDGAATTTSPTWTFTTSQPNGAPLATNPGDQTSAEGATVNLQIVASDPDGNTLTYSATGLPTGLAINSSTGVISGTVAFEAAVSNSVVVTVSDATASDTASFTWTVTRTNRAPVVTNPGAQNSAEGASPSLQIVASDPDGNALTYSATGLPMGLAISSSTGVISGTVAFGAAVSNSVVVTVSDATASDTASFTWTVTRTNRAPVVTNPGAQNSAEGASPSLQIVATDPDGNTLTYSATGLPTGLAINSSTGVISGTVAFGAAVTNDVTVTASDGSVSGTATFTWTVTRTNRAPVVSNPGAQSSAEGASPNLQIVASDPDGNPLTYSATGLPTGLAINSSTGVISGTVAFGASAINIVVVTVSDATASGTASFTWTVTATNRAPVVTNPGAQSSAEGSTPSIQVVATDPDGNTLTYSATGLPTGLAINSSTGLISGTVAFGATLTNSVVVTVSDGSLSDTANFTWTVTRTNRAPAVTTPGNQSSAEGASPSLQIVANDPDGNTLTYSATGLPTGLSINSSTGLIGGTVAFGAAVTNSVVVTVSDGSLSDTASFTWTVTRTNRAPVVTNPGAQSSAEGASPSLQIAANDPDGNTLTYSATGLPIGLSINSSTGVVSGTVAFGAAATNSVVATVSDGTATDTASFTWTVTRTNRAPVVTTPGNQSSAEGASPSLQIVANDPDGNTLTYSATGLPTGLSINSTSGIISGTVAFGAAVTNSVVVTVSDGTASDTASFTWTVTRTNRAPVVTDPADQSSAEGAVVSLQIAATDPDGNTLTYSATGLPTGVSINSSTGLITGTVAFGAAVTNSVVATVSDGTATDTASFTWTVTRTNRAPVVTTPGDQSSAEGASPSLQIVANDPDGNTLTYSATGLPTGLSINSTSGIISGTVAFGAAVTNSVIVTVNDGALSGTASFTWTVTPGNRAPLVTNPGAQSSAEGASPSLQIVASDPDGNTLTYSATGLPTGLSISSSGIISGTVAFGAAPSNSVVVTVSDGTANGTASFTWTVTRTNRAPVVTTPGAQSSAEGASPSLQIVASDPDGNTLTYSATGLPTGLSINSSTGVISGTVAFGAAPTNSVVVTVSDAAVTATASFTWTVTRTNRVPVANSQSVTTPEETATTITLTGSDADSDPLTFSIVTGPTHGTLSGTLPTVTYTPASNYSGADSFTFGVNDGTVSSALATVSLTVTPTADPPTLVTPGNQTSAEGASVNLQIQASDPDGPALTYAATGLPPGLAISSTTGLVTGTIAYTASVASPYSVIVTITDPTNASASAGFSWTVTNTNQAPVASPATVSTPKNQTLQGTVTATDADGDALTYVLVAQGRKGTATINAQTGAFAYSPAGSPNGTDTFTFKANDGTVDSNVATITVKFLAATANRAPLASNGTLSIDEDVSGAGNLVASDADGNALTYRIGTNGAKGSTTVNSSTGAFTYVPLANANGTDTFTFIANDGTTDSNTATITVTIAPVNDAPVATNDTATTAMNSPVSIAVLANDTDVDQQSLVIASVTNGNKGTAAINQAGTHIVYTPNDAAVGQDTFTYVARDPAGVLSNPATVTVTITAGNQAPTAQPQSVTTTEDTPRSVVLAGTDPDGQSLTFIVVTLPAHGTLSGTGPNVTYTPELNYSGSDSFSFTVNDGAVASAPAIVTITITAVNDAPVSTDVAVSTTKGVSVPGQLGASDIDSGSLTFEVLSLPKKGTVNLDETTGMFTYIPNSNAKGNDTFTFRASDGSLISNPAKVTVTIR